MGAPPANSRVPTLDQPVGVAHDRLMPRSCANGMRRCPVGAPTIGMFGLAFFALAGCHPLSPRQRELREMDEPDLCDTSEPQVRLVVHPRDEPTWCSGVRLIQRGEDALM